ncbi:hypothetical protein [Psychrobacillus soli]|uniref:Uncharacterized protein n=1 Tax=Psychrobacillus soli TaxID=1543965 RepID=A0A544TBJ7_9BACI|nr:hypothetical protein [Psychrobacillus soli]TQR14842.1 hypothetical protein FG383_10200 [Psychrobacillus soli]
MKKVHNEQGYTLLLTIVLISVVILLSATFTIKALSQQKQVERTDDTYEVTAITEMGVEYYRAKILNIISKYSNDTYNKLTELRVKNELTQDIIDSVLATQMLKLEESIGLFLNNSKGEKVYFSDLSQTIFFQIPEDNPTKGYFSVNRGSDGSWTIEVAGSIHNGSKSKIISATIKIPDQYYLATATETSGVLPIQPDPPPNSLNITFDSLINAPQPFPSVLPSQEVSSCGSSYIDKTCVDNNFSNLAALKNSIIYTNGSKNFSGNGLASNANSAIYVNGDMKTTSLNNLHKGINFYVSGKVTIPNAINPSGFLIWSKDNISIGGFNNLINSTDQKSDRVELYTLKKITIQNAIDAKYLSILADSADFNNFNSLVSSKIQIEQETTFKIINSMMYSHILINNNATFDTFNQGIKNESSISVKGTATFGFINGGIVDSIAKVGKDASFNQPIKLNNSTLLVGGKGTFRIQNSEAVIDNNSTVVVDSINFSSGGNNARLVVSNSSKLCIRNGKYENIKDWVQPKDHSKIIFLGSGKNLGHVFYYDNNEFNKECGISSAPIVTQPTYEIQNGSSLTEEDITSNIIYR